MAIHRAAHLGQTVVLQGSQFCFCGHAPEKCGAAWFREELEGALKSLAARNDITCVTNALEILPVHSHQMCVERTKA